MSAFRGSREQQAWLLQQQKNSLASVPWGRWLGNGASLGHAVHARWTDHRQPVPPASSLEPAPLSPELTSRPVPLAFCRYPVIFAVSVGVGCAIYNSIRAVATSPDFR